MSSTTHQKPTTPAPAPASAFGVTIASAQAAHTEKAGMDPTRKRNIMLIGGGVVLALISIWMRMPSKAEDPEAAAHPEVTKVEEMRTKQDTAGLTQMTKNSDAVVAARAVNALASIGGSDAVRDSLGDSRPEVRYMAVSGLGSSGDVRDLDALSDVMAQDPAPTVRIAAVRGISNIRDFSIFDRLFIALSDPEASVRRAALGAIEDRIGLKFPDYQPDGPGGARAIAINRMRTMISKMKPGFDTTNEVEVSREKANKK